MKVLVINGSPKGNKSITLQTMRFLALKFPEDSFSYLNVATTIRAIQKNPEKEISMIKESDLVVFSYPVYTFMAPAQLHQFIALLKEAGCDFTGITATQLTTSKHFYDVTAHTYIEENCRDLGFTVLPGLSADMEDLPKQEGQRQAVNFWQHIHWLMENQPMPEVNSEDYAVTIVTDTKIDFIYNEDTLTTSTDDLAQLIRQFQTIFPCKVKLISLADFPFQGGCLGCLKCAATGKCVYRDGFDTFLRDQVQATDAIIYAFTVQDHSMGALFKLYDDRQFCNGHRTVMMGRPVGYLVSGDIKNEPNLSMMLQARAQVGGNYLAGIANDESSVEQLSKEIIFALKNKYLPPQNFYGQGGMRIFRDLIFQMQGLMKLDHKFFKSHGQYNFPHNKPGTILAMYLVGILFSNPKLMKKMGSKIDEGMMAPYKKVLDKNKERPLVTKETS